MGLFAREASLIGDPGFTRRSLHNLRIQSLRFQGRINGLIDFSITLTHSNTICYPMVRTQAPL